MQTQNCGPILTNPRPNPDTGIHGSTGLSCQHSAHLPPSVTGCPTSEHCRKPRRGLRRRTPDVPLGTAEVCGSLGLCPSELGWGWRWAAAFLGLGFPPGWRRLGLLGWSGRGAGTAFLPRGEGSMSASEHAGRESWVPYK